MATNNSWNSAFPAAVPQGGLGVATLTAHSILVGAGTSAVVQVGPGATAGVPLVSAGASADPVYGTSVVAGGGTGSTSFTAYSLICAGTTSTGAFQNVSGVGSAGQVLTSAGAGSLPTWATPASAETPWTVVTGTTQSAAVNNGYFANNAGTVVITLPATAAVGNVVRVAGMNNATGWQIAQNAGQVIHFGAVDTTVGTGGSLASSGTFDSVELVCNVADDEWVVVSSVGNITYV